VQQRQFFTITALVIMITGCATQPDQTPVQRSWEDRLEQLQSLDDWRAEGKLALRNDQQSESASINWKQNEKHSQLDLNGPLGLGATTIHSDGTILEVTGAEGTKRYDISSPEAIIVETGWDLPLQALQYWLLGIPAPAWDTRELEVEAGLLKSLHQSGWSITYQSYGKFGHHELPTKLQIERADTRARIIIRNWTVGKAE
jgi:outer membrane lipoprotein LolB